MKQDIYFMPIGGGQRVGASCYFLRIGESNILLDAGIGKRNGLVFEPDLHALLTSPFLQSANQISRLFLSHAHMDHVGYLLKLMSQAPKMEVYATELTRVLSEIQLYDSPFLRGDKCGEEERLAAQNLFSRIAKVSYMRPMDFGSYKVTFFPAGHIPGAMMTLFDTGKRRILYTGDYSLEGTAFTQGCSFPSSLEVDTLILCGLHAKHPEYLKRGNTLFKSVQNVLDHVYETGESVRCYVPQLSKGVEFLKTLNQWNEKNIPIYVGEDVMQVVSKLEKLSIPVLDENDRILGEESPDQPHILVTSKRPETKSRCYREEKIDFSLHEDFEEMKEFIKRLNPKQAVIVHCEEEHFGNSGTIEQELMTDPECRTQFLFAEEKEIYKL